MGIESGAEKGPDIQANITKMIENAGSRQAVAERLRGLALVMPAMHDPETGNNLNTERVADAVESGNSAALADESPIWLNRALNEAGLGGEN